MYPTAEYSIPGSIFGAVPNADGMGSSRALHTQRYQAFLGRLRRAREAAKMTQVEVAQALGKRQTYVSKCELGERRVDFVELEDFAAVYRKPLSFFATGPTSQAGSPRTPDRRPASRRRS